MKNVTLVKDLFNGQTHSIAVHDDESCEIVHLSKSGNPIDLRLNKKQTSLVSFKNSLGHLASFEPDIALTASNIDRLKQELSPSVVKIVLKNAHDEALICNERRHRTMGARYHVKSLTESRFEGPRGVENRSLSSYSPQDRQAIVSFKAHKYHTKQKYATLRIEVKRVRAVFDANIGPGGGWRCPEGTMYGGQITDRFGRGCGGGITRRIGRAIMRAGQNMDQLGQGMQARRAGRRARAVERRARRAVRRDERARRRIGRVGRVSNRLERWSNALVGDYQPADRRTGREARGGLMPDGSLPANRAPAPNVPETPKTPRRPREVSPTEDFPAAELRNVRNRFPQRGLPGRAYWRDDDYDRPDKAELERRFGRYYDGDSGNSLNQRGRDLNNALAAERAPMVPAEGGRRRRRDLPAGPVDREARTGQQRRVTPSQEWSEFGELMREGVRGIREGRRRRGEREQAQRRRPQRDRGETGGIPEGSSPAVEARKRRVEDLIREGDGQAAWDQLQRDRLERQRDTGIPDQGVIDPASESGDRENFGQNWRPGQEPVRRPEVDSRLLVDELVEQGRRQAEEERRFIRDGRAQRASEAIDRAAERLVGSYQPAQPRRRVGEREDEQRAGWRERVNAALERVAQRLLNESRSLDKQRDNRRRRRRNERTPAQQDLEQRIREDLQEELDDVPSTGDRDGDAVSRELVQEEIDKAAREIADEFIPDDPDPTEELTAAELRNVRNRFPQRGLPGRAYWRDNDYNRPDKAELERRFGRYYDGDRGDPLNQRGVAVNNALAAERAQGQVDLPENVPGTVSPGRVRTPVSKRRRRSAADRVRSVISPTRDEANQQRALGIPDDYREDEGVIGDPGVQLGDPGNRGQFWDFVQNRIEANNNLTDEEKTRLKNAARSMDADFRYDAAYWDEDNNQSDIDQMMRQFFKLSDSDDEYSKVLGQMYLEGARRRNALRHRKGLTQRQRNRNRIRESELEDIGSYFRERRLPERAYWRDSDYQPAGDRDAKDRLDRRFGRFYDEDGRLNERGLLVNEEASSVTNPADAERAAQDSISRLIGRDWMDRIKAVVALDDDEKQFLSNLFFEAKRALVNKDIDASDLNDVITLIDDYKRSLTPRRGQDIDARAEIKQEVMEDILGLLRNKQTALRSRNRRSLSNRDDRVSPSRPVSPDGRPSNNRNVSRPDFATPAPDPTPQLDVTSDEFDERIKELLNRNFNLAEFFANPVPDPFNPGSQTRDDRLRQVMLGKPRYRAADNSDKNQAKQIFDDLLKAHKDLQDFLDTSDDPDKRALAYTKQQEIFKVLDELHDGDLAKIDPWLEEDLDFHYQVWENRIDHIGGLQGILRAALVDSDEFFQDAALAAFANRTRLAEEGWMRLTDDAIAAGADPDRANRLLSALQKTAGKQQVVDKLGKLGLPYQLLSDMRFWRDRATSLDVAKRTDLVETFQRGDSIEVVARNFDEQRNFLISALNNLEDDINRIDDALQSTGMQWDERNALIQQRLEPIAQFYGVDAVQLREFLTNANTNRAIPDRIQFLRNSIENILDQREQHISAMRGTFDADGLLGYLDRIGRGKLGPDAAIDHFLQEHMFYASSLNTNDELLASSLLRPFFAREYNAQRHTPVTAEVVDELAVIGVPIPSSNNWARADALARGRAEAARRRIEAQRGIVDPFVGGPAEKLAQRVRQQRDRQVAKLRNFFNKRYPNGEKPWEDPTLNNVVDAMMNMDNAEFKEWGYRVFDGVETTLRKPGPEDTSPEADAIRQSWPTNMPDEVILRSKVSSATIYNSNDAGVRGVFEIIDPSNGAVLDTTGNFTRAIKIDSDGNPWVYHEYFRTGYEPWLKRNGMATVFNGHAYNWYKGAGVKKVKVSPGLSDGPFVWYKTGFDAPVQNPSAWDRSDWNNNGDELRKIADNLRSAMTDFEQGVPSIINNVDDYEIVKMLIEKGDTEGWNTPKAPQVYDFLMALDSKADGQSSAERSSQLRSWLDYDVNFNGVGSLYRYPQDEDWSVGPEPTAVQAAVQGRKRADGSVARPAIPGQTGLISSPGADGDPAVPRLIVNDNIQSEQEAADFVAMGGSLGEVPNMYWQYALTQNTSDSAVDLNARFYTPPYDPAEGAIGDTRIFVYRNADGTVGDTGYVLKSASLSEDLSEMIGFNLDVAHGMAVEGPGMDGPSRYGTGFFVVIPFATQQIPDGVNVENQRDISGRMRANGVVPWAVSANFDSAMFSEARFQGIPEMVQYLMHEYLLGGRDRHHNNVMGYMVDGQPVIVPIDHGWSFDGIYGSVDLTTATDDIWQYERSHMRAFWSEWGVASMGWNGNGGMRYFVRQFDTSLANNPEERAAFRADIIAKVDEMIRRTTIVSAMSVDEWMEFMLPSDHYETRWPDPVDRAAAVAKLRQHAERTHQYYQTRSAWMQNHRDLMLADLFGTANWQP